MAFVLRFQDADAAKLDAGFDYAFLNAFEQHVRFSRFELRGKKASYRGDHFTWSMIRHRLVLKIWSVRLKEAKPYCGNHAYPCAIANPGRSGRERNGSCLEGADWVAWNDMLNDLLDNFPGGKYGFPQPRGLRCDAGSSLVTIRKGYGRCVKYKAHIRGGEWYKEGDYADCRFDLPARIPRHAIYPEGTPGCHYWWDQDRSTSPVDEFPDLYRLPPAPVDLDAFLSQ